MSNHRLSTLALAVSSLAVSSLALPACSDRGLPSVVMLRQPDNPGAMNVTGSATLEVSPDCADLTMTVAGDGARPGAATADAQHKQAQVIDALVHAGIDRKDLKLSTLRLEPVYAQSPTGVTLQRITGYRAEVIVTATTHQFDRIAPIMEASADAGASSIATEFRRSDLAALKNQIRAQALQAARDKAAQTATTLGITLGRIVSVSEAPAGAIWSNEYFPNTSSRDSSGGLGGSLQPLTLQVTVGYELAAKT